MSPRMRFVSIFFVSLLAAAVLAFPPPSHAQGTPYTGFQAFYYQGTELRGAPILTRLEPVVNWNYEPGNSPAQGVVPATDFSTRWEGWYNMDHPGAWTFTYTSDDGGRVWIDNELVVEMWYDHGPLTRSRTKGFAAGYHLVRVEYYQRAGGMTSQLTITPPGTFPDWMGEYFDNPYLLGEPRYRVNNIDINFNWGSGTPDPRISPENFSVRWTRLYTFGEGNYTFSATADDGIRVWVGDILAIDGWVPQQAKTYTNTLRLNGTYPLRVEYFEQGGDAVVNFFFSTGNAAPRAPTTQTWNGQLFNNPGLSGTPVCVQEAAQINFNWGGNSPGCGVAGQLFSGRWDSTLTPPATGFYAVYLTVDDGARIFVDDKLILDAWREQPPTEYSTTVYLDASAHRWRIEYFQSAGGAQLLFNLVAGVTILTPRQTPADEIIVDATGAGWTQGGEASAWHATANGYGDSALWTDNHAFIQPLYSWGRWYPPLAQGRNYEVFVYIPGELATTTNARYWIFHAGSSDSVAVAQGAYRDEWVSLGTFYFSGQGGEYVALSDVTYEPDLSRTLVWDAVKFTPR